MSQKFISLDDAAEQLGVSKDRLNELRESGKLRAYRDGASWKFRSEEIDGLAESGELASDGGPDVLPLGDDEDDDLVLGVEPLGDGDDAESILLTDDDDELEGGLPRPQSTIIGKSELSLEDDLALTNDNDSDLTLSEGSTPDADKASFAGLEELELDLEAESSRILDPATAAAAKEAAEQAAASEDPSDDGLGLGDDDDYELELTGSATDVTSEADPNTGSGSSLPGSVSGLSDLEDIQLGEDVQDDLVLGDSDPSLSTSDSGINLAPSDSGIALDDVPLDLGGSAVGSALDLAALSAASAEHSSAGEDAGLASAEDFELTPASSEEDDEEDSSQIVALDDIQEEEEVAFEEEEMTEESEGFGGGLSEAGMGASAAGLGVAAATPATATAAVEQVAFPGWIIAMLSLTMLSMILCGMMAFDLLQSMWAWDEPFGVNSALMDVFAGN